MKWLSRIVDDIVARKPKGEILIESGSSPSGTYHLGHLRELVTCDAILLELKRRGRQAIHIAYVDDLDALRKIPVNVPPEYKKYLGVSLCDVPAPDNSKRSYADYFLQDLIDVSRALAMEIEFVRTHEKYRAGFFVPAIERSLQQVEKIGSILEGISGHKLDETWSPIQINEEGYLKKRQFISLDVKSKTITYLDKDQRRRVTTYQKGEVKLDWRIDWPARWWLLKVDVEPFGRDHATKGGSYDTGSALSKEVFEHEPPLSVPYDFVNLVGDTKKMSASGGTGLDAAGAVKVLPPEIVRYFMLRYPPSKRLYFDPVNVAQLIDDFAELVEKSPNSPIIDICRRGLNPIISRIPFSHLAASYQGALKNVDATLELLRRTGYGNIVDQNQEILRGELKYIDEWLKRWAPEEVKFELLEKADLSKFGAGEKDYLSALSQKIAQAPADADGEWFHKAIYELKESRGLKPEQVFKPLYKALIGKEQGPRAGWFLSILPRDWLVKRLKLLD